MKTDKMRQTNKRLVKEAWCQQINVRYRNLYMYDIFGQLDYYLVNKNSKYFNFKI